MHFREIWYWGVTKIYKYLNFNFVETVLMITQELFSYKGKLVFIKAENI